MSTYAQIFQTLLNQQVAAGEVLAGGKVYFYTPGTSNLATVYTDRNKGTAAANPGTLSANGNLAVFGDGQYDVKITDSDLVQKYYWYGVSLVDFSDSLTNVVTTTYGKIASVYDLAMYANLPTAIATIGSTKATLRYGSAVALAADLTNPENIELQPYNGAIITVASGKTLTINGPFAAGRYQCFAGAGAVVFGSNSISAAYPDWFASNSNPGTTDMTTAIQSALSSYCTISLQDNTTYKVTGATTIENTRSYSITIIGNNSTISGLTSTADPLIRLGGSVGTPLPLLASVSLGGTAVTSNASTASGDIIQILSTDAWSAGSAAMVKGELQVVKSVVGTTINISGSLWDGYTDSTTNIAKISAPIVTVKGVNILQNANVGGLTVRYAKNITIDTVTAKGNRERGIYVEQCFGGIIRNCYTDDNYYAGSGTSYGIVVDSSCNILEQGNVCLSGRHGMAHGGTFPYRCITCHGNTIGSTTGISTYSLDFHANGEFITATDNTILNGAGIECRDFNFSNNNVSVLDYLSGVLINAYESYGRATVTGNTVRNIKTDGRGITVTTSGSTAVTIDALKINGNSVTCPNIGVYVTNSATGSLILSELDISGNGVISSAYAPIYVKTQSATNITANITANDNVSTSGRGMLFEFNGNLITNNNIIKATTNDTYMLETIGTHDAIVMNNVFDGTNKTTGGLGVTIGNTGVCQFGYNIIKNASSVGGLRTLSAVTVFNEFGTLLNNNTGTISHAATANIGIISGAGSPETNVAGTIGKLFTRTDGSTSTTLYVKTTNDALTGWVAK